MHQQKTRTVTQEPAVTTQTVQTETNVDAILKEEPKKAEKVPVEFPNSIDDIESYILSFMDDKYKSTTTIDVDTSTNTPGGYIVVVTTTSNDLGLESSKTMARNVIVATYNAIYEKIFP